MTLIGSAVRRSRPLVCVLWRSVAALMILSAGAAAQDADAPCGRDQYNNPLQCTQPSPSANLESTCLTTGRVEICVAYHQNACFIRGFQLACRLYQMGMNCSGGDQNICNQYISLLRANTSCTLDRNPSACAFLQQQGF